MYTHIPIKALSRNLSLRFLKMKTGDVLNMEDLKTINSLVVYLEELDLWDKAVQSNSWIKVFISY